MTVSLSSRLYLALDTTLEIIEPCATRHIAEKYGAQNLRAYIFYLVGKGFSKVWSLN